MLNIEQIVLIIHVFWDVLNTVFVDDIMSFVENIVVFVE